MIRLRPHHILCMRAFRGMGYSPSFVRNMHTVIAYIKKEGRAEIISGCDDICSSCPHLIEAEGDSGAMCDGEEKVAAIDAKACAFLGLSDGIYTCDELEHKVKNDRTHSAGATTLSSFETKPRG